MTLRDENVLVFLTHNGVRRWALSIGSFQDPHREGERQKERMFKKQQSSIGER